MKFMSYALAAVAGLCFASGVFIITNEGDNTHGEIRNIFRLD